MIYLDSAATSLIKPRSVQCAMIKAMNSMASPGRGSHRAAALAADKVYECREAVCELMNFDKPDNIVFTMNATHALNIAIRSTVKEGDKVVISGYEHNSVTRVLRAIGADTVVAESGLFDTEDALCSFRRLIPGAKAVICNHVSNVFGYIQPVLEISEMCRELEIPFILDASQSAGIIPINAGDMYFSYIAMPGHKGLLGPQGTGILVCRNTPEPFMFGGTGSDSILQDMPDYLPDILEAGTHNVPGIAGLNAGIRHVMKMTPSCIGKYEEKLCGLMAHELASIPGLEVFSTDAGTQSGVLSVRHEFIDCERLCEKLGEKGIAARCGLHCAPLAHKSADTIKTGTLRLSFSPFITREQTVYAAKMLKKIITEEK